jgi:hypothetical protein
MKLDTTKPLVVVKTFYISGPMRGHADFNFPSFLACEAALPEFFAENWGTSEALSVLNPARNFDGDTTLPITTYMRRDIIQVAQADLIVLLPGWEASEGARLEVSIGKATGAGFIRAFAPDSYAPAWSFVRDFVPELADGIEAQAAKLVYGDRAATYGHPRGDFDKVAGMWSAILDVPITADMVAVMMVAFKLARLSKSPAHRDTQVDVIGYVLCLDRLIRGVLGARLGCLRVQWRCA